MNDYYTPNMLRYREQKAQGATHIVPSRVTIETVFGCNADCIMCVVHQPSHRKKGSMSMALFQKIIDELSPYHEQIEMMDLFCLGEPLLDRHLLERIKYAKEKGFRNLALSTNAQLLTRDRQEALLNSGIETIIFSIDGILKETHEGIRKNLDYDVVLANCLSMIKLRNEGNYATRFVVRFIRQTRNRDEWESYKEFWESILRKDKRDLLMRYDAHTWGGQLTSKESSLNEHEKFREPEIEQQACYQVFDILYVLADGSVPMCSEDWLHPIHNYGNANDQHPLDIFNSKKFNNTRDVHLAGTKACIKHCSECTLLYSRTTRKIYA